MSRRTGPAAPAAPTSSRQNEYFVPRDGIDREVITADICRYLGNDALVRPGTYENPGTGQVIQGYFINAYRNLTTAMIEDLKADSARWDQERRQHSAQRSTAGVQYRNSETHSSRQYFGPSDSAPSGPSGYTQQDPRDQYDSSGPRYPGTGSAGYTGASSGNFQGQSYGGQPGYGAPPQQNYPAQSPQHQQQPGNMQQFSGHPQVPHGQFSQQGQYPPYQDVGANSMVRPGQSVDTAMGGYDQYPPRDPRDSRGIPVTAVPVSRSSFATSGTSQQQAFQGAQGGPGFYPPGSSSGQQQFGAQPHDPFYGRGGYPQEPQQFESTPAPSRTPTSTAPVSQAPPTAPSSSHRRERDSRDSVERSDARHSHRSDRPGSDRHPSRRP